LDTPWRPSHAKLAAAVAAEWGPGVPTDLAAAAVEYGMLHLGGGKYRAKVMDLSGGAGPEVEVEVAEEQEAAAGAGAGAAEEEEDDQEDEDEDGDEHEDGDGDGEEEQQEEGKVEKKRKDMEKEEEEEEEDDGDGIDDDISSSEDEAEEELDEDAKAADAVFDKFIRKTVREVKAECPGMKYREVFAKCAAKWDASGIDIEGALPVDAGGAEADAREHDEHDKHMERKRKQARAAPTSPPLPAAALAGVEHGQNGVVVSVREHPGAPRAAGAPPWEGRVG